jgi:hypothetical protein
LTKSQVAAFRRNSSKDEKSDSNLTSEDDSQGDNQTTSPQNLLPQNFSSTASTVRLLTKSKSLLKGEEMSEINNHLTKATKISSLNESSD